MTFIELSIWWRGGLYLKNEAHSGRVVDDTFTDFDLLNNYNNFPETIQGLHQTIQKRIVEQT